VVLEGRLGLEDGAGSRPMEQEKHDMEYLIVIEDVHV